MDDDRTPQAPRPRKAPAATGDGNASARAPKRRRPTADGKEPARKAPGGAAAATPGAEDAASSATDQSSTGTAGKDSATQRPTAPLAEAQPTKRSRAGKATGAPPPPVIFQPPRRDDPTDVSTGPPSGPRPATGQSKAKPAQAPAAKAKGAKGAKSAGERSAASTRAGGTRKRAAATGPAGTEPVQQAPQVIKPAIQQPPVEPSTEQTPAAPPQPAAERIPTAEPAPTLIEQPSAVGAAAPQATGSSVRHWLVKASASPSYAPEILAMAAVDTIGRQAQEWADELRRAYPAASGDGLARLAVRRFARIAAAGGLAATATGLLAPLSETAVRAWTQASVALHVAAAYGLDPTERERAVDLLVLIGVHADRRSAAAALDAATDAHGARGADAPPPPDADARTDTVERVRHTVQAVGRLAAPLAATTAGWLALRTLARLVPAARLVVIGAGGAAGAERVARRAIEHFRKASPGGPGQSQPTLSCSRV